MLRSSITVDSIAQGFQCFQHGHIPYSFAFLGIGTEELVGRALKLLNRILIIYITRVMTEQYGDQCALAAYSLHFYPSFNTVIGGFKSLWNFRERQILPVSRLPISPCITILIHRLLSKL